MFAAADADDATTKSRDMRQRRHDSCLEVLQLLTLPLLVSLIQNFSCFTLIETYRRSWVRRPRHLFFSSVEWDYASIAKRQQSHQNLLPKHVNLIKIFARKNQDTERASLISQDWGYKSGLKLFHPGYPSTKPYGVNEDQGRVKMYLHTTIRRSNRVFRFSNSIIRLYTF